jgi:carboxymethylenebutenolidase
MSMIETDLQIHTTDGISDSAFFRPDGPGCWPGVLHFTDIRGIRPAYREMGRRLAAQGYAVLMPNVFYRTGKPPMLDFKPVMGEERTMKRLAEISGPLTPEAMERDASTYLDCLSAENSVAAGPVGVVGYCFTGAMALRAAAARPEKVAAAASFHGGGLHTDTATSPHLVLHRVKAKLYFGHAVQDRMMPQEAIDRLSRALDAWGGKYESEVYEGAFHSWTTLDSPVYNECQAERAFLKLTELLTGALGSSA